MSFSPLLSKRISQTQISQILLFVKAPSFFSSARWYIFILVPWVLNLERSPRDFSSFLPPHPIPSWGVLKPDVLIEKKNPLVGPTSDSAAWLASCCKCVFSHSWCSFSLIQQVYLLSSEESLMATVCLSTTFQMTPVPPPPAPSITKWWCWKLHFQTSYVFPTTRKGNRHWQRPSKNWLGWRWGVYSFCSLTCHFLYAATL